MTKLFFVSVASLVAFFLMTTKAQAQVVGGRIICESKHANEYVECDTRLAIANPAIVKEYSANLCAYNVTWGFTGTKIWVNQGCRAQFSYDVACDQDPVPAPAPAPAPAPQPAPYPAPTPAPAPTPVPPPHYPSPQPRPPAPPARHEVDCRWNNLNWQPFYKTASHFIGLPGYGFSNPNTCVYAVQNSRNAAVCNWTGRGFTAYDMETNGEVDSILYQTLAQCSAAIP